MPWTTYFLSSTNRNVFTAPRDSAFFSFAAISPTAAGEGQQQSGKNSARPSSVSLRQTYKPIFHRGWCRHICTPLVYVHMCNLLLLLASFQHCQECILHPDSDEQDTWQSTTHPNSHALPPSCFIRIHGRFTSLPCILLPSVEGAVPLQEWFNDTHEEM